MATLPLFCMAQFFLSHLTAISDNTPIQMNVSISTATLALQALIDAEERGRWLEVDGVVDDTEWSQAEYFLWLAIRELTGGQAMQLQFVAHLSVAQTANGGAYADHIYEIDTVEAGTFDTVNHKWICPVDGLYRIGGVVQFGPQNVSTGMTRIRVQRTRGANSAIIANSGNYQDGLASSYKQAMVEGDVYLLAGDEIDFLVAHAASSADTSSYVESQRVWGYRIG